MPGHRAGDPRRAAQLARSALNERARRQTLWRALGLLLGCAWACGCQPQGEPVGDLVGIYAIDGTLIENTCGPMALPTVDPLRFEVEVRHSGPVGYWQIEKRAAKAGSLDDSGHFRFRAEQTTLVGQRTQARDDLSPADFTSLAPDFDLETKRCLMTVRETIEGELARSVLGSPFDAGLADAGAEQRRPRAANDLTADNTIEVSATADSDCSTSLQALGGPFLALPCSARYRLEGKLQDGIPD